ncbi:hypothetical protein GCM10011379_57770 [Filimonas zeae]|uniref:DUF5689 domain-containing protein n=2 Tax=Filimonas zeae TaxID=1737353 RepID=A0A917J4Y9_9BACT|nr:hypothetical protein GCM10011379_57770 [Filimonas zeae]
MLLSWSCNRVFDAPEPFPDADIKATITIQDLKALHAVKGRFDRITADGVIAGVVTADDRSGNFYRSIVLQDNTGGIALLLERTGLYNDYPIGRKVFVKVKGLMLGDYRGLIQLGADVDVSDPADITLAGIAASLLSRYLVKGSLNNVVVPATVTKAQLTTALHDPYQNTLIRLNNAEFAVADSGATYANAKAKITGSYRLYTCTDTLVAVRTSAYATFAGIRLPAGNGTVTGIYSVFNSEKQLMIRDTADVQLKALRCTRVTVPDVEQPYTAGIALTASPLLLHFNALDSVLPQGMYLYTGATATGIGTATNFIHSRTSWANTSGGFKNYASAAGLQMQSTQAQQQAANDRAAGVRQVTVTDKGVAFVFEINNTTGKTGIELDWNMQSLDAGAERTTQWTVDYAQGLNPTVFTPLQTIPEVVITGGGRFSNTPIKVVLPEVLHNNSRKLTLRIAALQATAGSGSRATTAIDNVRISWR